eukprot:s3796_g2.t1
MGSRFSECSSVNSQHVKDCCHLEGETPIEIRIAFSQQGPAAYPSHEGAAPRAFRIPTHLAATIAAERLQGRAFLCRARRTNAKLAEQSKIV